ncbi:hypothetical protein AAC03nite_16210 [Alicyclobacillus acidoterrestris]|nr:hypothetical protein AAC03nite_16210 [Alicyclobacillus acidoterrestris]
MYYFWIFHWYGMADLGHAKCLFTQMLPDKGLKSALSETTMGPVSDVDHGLTPSLRARTSSRLRQK